MPLPKLPIVVTVLACVVGTATEAAAQGEAAPPVASREPVVPTPPSLLLDAKLGAPSPAEYFLSLSKSTNPRWRKCYRELAPQPPTERTKVAAGLGMLAADAHLAAMARDDQRVRNVAGEISAFAKMLGLSESAAPRVAALEAAAKEGQWRAAHLELEVLVTALGDKLREQRDDDLARLVDIGLWVRAVHAGSGVVAAGEVTDYTMAAGGSGIPGWIAITAAGLSERCRANPDVEYMLRQGEKLVRVWAPERIASGYEFKMEQVVDTHERLGGIINHLSKR